MRLRILGAAALAVALSPLIAPGRTHAQTGAPVITGYALESGLAVTSARPGTQLRIKGTNFASPGTLRFNGTRISFNAWAGTYIRIVVPTLAVLPTTAPFTLTTSGGLTASGPAFTITGSSTTTPPPTPPTISAVTNTNGTALSSAVPGTVVKVTGANLGTSGTLKIAGVTAATTAWSGSSITGTVPTPSSLPITGPVTVTTGGQTATGSSFTITAPATTQLPPAPSITGYRNTAGAAITAAVAGSTVRIVGSNLGSSGSVTFNGIAATATAYSSTSVTVTVPTAGSYPNTGPVRVTTGGQTATGPNFTINAPVSSTPSPPPAPAVTGYRSTGGTALTSSVPGTSVVIVGANLGTGGTVRFNGIAAVTTTWTSGSVTATVPTAGSYPNTGPVTVATGGQTATGPSFTINAPPAVVGARNVRNYGARGDGATDDSAAIQKALDAVQPGEGVYFPAGTYRLGTTLQVRTSNIRVYGDGDSSTLSGDSTQRHLVNVYNSFVITSVRFESLRFLGSRVFDKRTNHGAGVALALNTGTQFTSCTFEGLGSGVSDGNSTTATSFTNCRFRDWGGIGVFLNAGSTVLNCTFEQHDPNSADQVTSHAVYIHSGANNVRVQGCSFSGVRYYAIQIYGQDAGTTMSNIQVTGNQFFDNCQDVIVQSAGPIVSNVYITDNSFWRTKGWSVQLKRGSGLHVDRNRFYDTTTGAVQAGNWAPYDAGITLSDITIDDNSYSQNGPVSPQFVFQAAGVNGTLSNVSIRRNTVQSFREPGTYQAAAILLDQVRGAAAEGNTLTMASGAGSANICAGVKAVNGCTAVQITGNTINGTGTQYAHGVYGSGLSGTGSSVTGNILNRCKLEAGGAAASGNTINP